jgi:hypothetical protein
MFYLMNKTADTKTTSKFLDAYLMVKRVKPNRLIFSVHDRARGPSRGTWRESTSRFTFSARSKSRSIDNAVLGPLLKRLLFTTIKNAYFNGSVETNPYIFTHYISEFSLYVNGKRVPSEGFIAHEKTSVMGYRTLFEESDIHHSISELQITRHITSLAISCSSFTSLPTGVIRRLIRHSLIMATSGSNCNLPSHDDPHVEGGSQWLFIRLTPCSSSA